MDKRELYEFGDFRLDVPERDFQRIDDGTPIALPEKAFQTLVVLVRNSGHLVSKRELLDEVWPDSFVEENNLDKTIHLIRHALGESPETKYIETVRKHGYRLVAKVRRIYAGQRPGSGDVIVEGIPRLTESGQHALVSISDWHRAFDPKVIEQFSRERTVEKEKDNTIQSGVRPPVSIGKLVLAALVVLAMIAVWYGLTTLWK